MTWDELNERYPEARDEMSVDRERAFLEDLYNAYETVGFVNNFWTPFDLKEEDKNYVGKPFKVVGRCEEGKEWDLESLPAWKIEFEDGHKMNAYPEEIYLNDMVANGYEPNRNMSEKVTEEMREMLKKLADLAYQCSEEVYDDDENGTAGILCLCDKLVAKTDAYLEREKL